MKSSRLKVCLALIHNNDINRYRYIRSELDNLKKGLSRKFDVKIIEVKEQPEIENHSLGMTLKRKVFLWKLNREWVKYKKMGPRNIFLDLVVLIRRLILTFINRSKESRRSVVDSYVTGKHLRAWEQFWEMEFDFLICFEDDAVFKKDSVKRLKSFFRGLQANKEKVAYFDLAGGLSPDVLKVENLKYKKTNGRVYYKKPVTNTGCVYMFNRTSVKIFFFYLLKNPMLRLIGADWLLNKLFILSTPKYKYLCYHANPPVFSHGSATGSYTSWLKI